MKRYSAYDTLVDILDVVEKGIERGGDTIGIAKELYTSGYRYKIEYDIGDLVYKVVGIKREGKIKWKVKEAMVVEIGITKEGISYIMDIEEALKWTHITYEGIYRSELEAEQKAEELNKKEAF